MSVRELTEIIDSASYDGRNIDHEPGLYTTVSVEDDFDHVVGDINVVLTGIDRTVNWSRDFRDNYEDEAIQNTPFEEFLDDDRFTMRVEPQDNYSIMAGIASEATLYVPDHVIHCLSTGLEKGFKGNGAYPEAEEIAYGIKDFLELYAEPLPVLEKMGVSEYSRQALRSRHPGKDEDDFIVEAARELDGDTVVATYDADYIDLEIDAAAPRAVEHVLRSR